MDRRNTAAYIYVRERANQFYSSFQRKKNVPDPGPLPPARDLKNPKPQIPRTAPTPFGRKSNASRPVFAVGWAPDTSSSSLSVLLPFFRPHGDPTETTRSRGGTGVRVQNTYLSSRRPFLR